MKSACWLVVAMSARTLVDGSKVVQHAVRPLRFQLQVAQNVAHAVPSQPTGSACRRGFFAWTSGPPDLLADTPKRLFSSSSMSGTSVYPV